jgi:hypothetical protein
MVSVQLKIIDEGLQPDLDELTERLRNELADENVQLDPDADLTLKVKFVIDNDQELVLLQLRESATKIKLREKVIHYNSNSLKEDVALECKAMLAPLTTEVA